MRFGNSSSLSTAAPGLASTCYPTDGFSVPIETRTTSIPLKHSAPPGVILLPSRIT